jgi:hypothetical protein
MTSPSGIGVIRVLAVAATALAATAAAAGTFSDLKPADPQPAASALEPGLAVNYVFKKVRSVNEIERAGPGEPGKPLPKLEYNSGSAGVLTSGQSDHVGALIHGFINFPEAGRWLMATQSNDGVRVKVAGEDVILDDGVHRDQFSENAEINIATPGWYPLDITYFERENTATLELYWQRPDKDEFEIVPADAFAHAK